MEREHIRSQQSPVRCPFCHEGIEVEVQEWVACQACLGRHHATCWSEMDMCASCQGTAVLKGEGITPTQEGEVLGSPVEHEGSVEELHKLIEAHEKSSGGSIMDFVLSYPTAGLYPLVRAEQRLLENVKRNETDLKASGVLEGDPRLARHAEDAVEGTRRGARNRLGSLIAMFLVSLSVALAGIVRLATATFSIHDDIGGALCVIAGILWSLSLLVCLYLGWRAVRKHDSKQLYTGILGQGLSEERAKKSLANHEAAWGQNGKLVVITLFGCLLWPFSPLFVALASTMAMNLHDKREGSIETMSPQRETTKDDSRA